MGSSPLTDIIKDRIRVQGFMDMGEYMALCLGHPQHGYYMTRDPFGRNGDFITAPEVSQMFGEMIGMWLADLWIKMGRPSEFILLEMGPGRGTLMEDILRTTKSLPGFHAAMKLHLMEMSPVLKAAQKQKLGIYDPVWIDDLAALNSAIPVLVVANEFLDALPVRQLVRRGGAWWERVVAIDENDTFRDAIKQMPGELIPLMPDDILSGHEDGVFEASPVLNHIIKSVDILLKKQGGVALFLDYGHAHSAMGDTLQAMKDHAYTSIFDTPGSCDLTTHVDFENIARTAQSDDIIVHGPTTQGAFLKELGIEVRAERLLAGANAAQAEDLRSGMHRLIDTDQMGSLFKVIALTSDPNMEIAGFHDSL